MPALFTALKVAVDRRRVSGRFILTGSANVMGENMLRVFDQIVKTAAVQ